MGVRLPKDPTHPGEMLLEEFLKPMGLTQSAFAKHIGVSFKRMSEIVNGRRSITSEAAWLLSQALGATPKFWTNLQTTYDLVYRRAGREVGRIKASVWGPDALTLPHRASLSAGRSARRAPGPSWRRWALPPPRAAP